MIAQNVAQIAHLNAQIQGARRVFFTGNFLRKNDLALKSIVFTMQRWSQLEAKSRPGTPQTEVQNAG
jgi:type II pantothenate kinase